MKKLILILFSALIFFNSPFSATAEGIKIKSNTITNGGSPGIRNYRPTWTPYYSYLSSIFKDIVSRQATTTTQLTGRYGYEGGSFGTDDPVIESGKLQTNGGYKQLILKSRDISDAVWTDSGSPTKTATTFTATAQSDRTYQGKITNDGELYTLSFIASVASGGQLENYTFLTGASADGNEQPLTLTHSPEQYEVTVLGKTGSGTVNFGFRDNNASNWALVTITDFQVTASSYLLPYAQNDSAVDTLQVPNNFSDETYGYKQPIGSVLPPIDSDNWVEVDGVEINTQANAINPVSDSDAITGWSQTSLGANTFESQSSIVSGSTYAFHANVNTTPTAGGRFWKDIQTDFSLVNGVQYKIEVDIRHVGVAIGDGDWKAALGPSSSSTSLTISELVKTDIIFEHIVYRFTHVTDTTKYLFFRELNDENDGGVYVDNLSIKRIEPSQSWTTQGQNLLDAFDGVASGVELYTGVTGEGANLSVVADVVTVDTAGAANDNRFRISGTTVINGYYEFQFTCTEGGIEYFDNAIAGYVDLGVLPAGSYTYRTKANGTTGLLVRAVTLGMTVSDFSMKAVSTAKAQISFPWIPRYGYLDGISSTTDVHNLMTPYDVAKNFIFIERDSDWGSKSTINLKDGTNTAVADSFQFVLNTQYQVDAKWGPSTELSSDLLAGLDFTSGWSTAGTVVIDDSNSFTSTGNGGVHKAGLLTVGKEYQVVLTGSTTASDIEIRNSDGEGSKGLIGTGFGTYIFTAGFDATVITSTAIYLRNVGSGTTDITTFTIQATNQPKMSITVTDLSEIPAVGSPWTSGQVDFNYRFPIGDWFSFAYDNIYPQLFGPYKIKKDFTW